MEYVFDYKVSVPGKDLIIAEGGAVIALNEEQYKRVMDSKASGKYEYIDQDANIRDIFQMVYEEAIAEEAQNEYGHLVGEG